jgi:hypothetical protein
LIFVFDKPFRGGIATLVAILAIAALGVGFFASAANAEVVEGMLKGKNWTIGEKFNVGFESAQDGQNLSICVGPAQISGSKWVFPYGWNCSATNYVSWSYTRLLAFPAVDNPNSPSMYFSLIAS